MQECFSICSPDVLPNTWGALTTGCHQRPHIHTATQRKHTLWGWELLVHLMCFQKQHLGQISLQPLPDVCDSEGAGALFFHTQRATRKCCKSPQRHLFMYPSPLFISVQPSMSGLQVRAFIGPPRSMRRWQLSAQDAHRENKAGILWRTRHGVCKQSCSSTLHETKILQSILSSFLFKYLSTL